MAFGEVAFGEVAFGEPEFTELKLLLYTIYFFKMKQEQIGGQSQKSWHSVSDVITQFCFFCQATVFQPIKILY